MRQNVDDCDVGLTERALSPKAVSDFSVVKVTKVVISRGNTFRSTCWFISTIDVSNVLEIACND